MEKTFIQNLKAAFWPFFGAFFIARAVTRLLSLIVVATIPGVAGALVSYTSAVLTSAVTAVLIAFIFALFRKQVFQGNAALKMAVFFSASSVLGLYLVSAGLLDPRALLVILVLQYAFGLYVMSTVLAVAKADSVPSGDTALVGSDQRDGFFARFLQGTELDSRMLGMIGALALIWIGFHFYGQFTTGEGIFITPRNLWNLSVQTSSIGIMATGMVLVIITRNIDLSVGSLIGVIGMIMGILQVEVLPKVVGLGHPSIWILTVIVGLALGAALGAFHGWLIAYRGIPAFIVTLGGLLVWRGAAFLVADGKTIAPLDATFTLLGGGPYGAVGSTGSWIVGIIGCAAIIWVMSSARAGRKKHDIRLRPVWGDIFVGLVACSALIGAVLVVDSYPWPKGIVKDYAAANGLTLDPATTFISHGFAIPVLIMAVVAIIMTILMTRTRFGRYVFAIGGNPEAATLAGIDTRWMTVKIFSLMGLLAGVAAVVSSARLNSATNALGNLDELYVIASAVIGGTSLAGGVGTIYGAIIGAFIMASLQTGMVLIGFGDGSYRSIVVGVALVLAVYLDNLYRNYVK